MGLFGGSKSDSSSSPGTAAAQTQLGNPISINTSAGKKSYSNVYITKTDYGSVAKSFDLADKVLDKNSDLVEVAQGFALDTLAAAQSVSSEIIEAGKYSAGATERIAGAFEEFVDEQNNPNEKNQMILILAVLAGLAVVVVKVKE